MTILIGFHGVRYRTFKDFYRLQVRCSDRTNRTHVKKERKLAKTNPISQDKVEAELAALANKPDDSALVALKVLRNQVGFEAVNLAFKAICKRDRLTSKGRLP